MSSFLIVVPAPAPCRFGSSPICPWSCHQSHPPKNFREYMLFHAPNNRSGNHRHDYEPRSSSITWTQLHTTVTLKAVLFHSVTQRESSPSNRKVKCVYDCWPQAALWPGSRHLLPHSGGSPAHPGTQQELHLSMSLLPDMLTTDTTADPAAATWPYSSSAWSWS